MTIQPTDANILCLFCDNVRQEAGGKATLLGYFGGNEILIPPNSQYPVQLQLGVVFVLQDGEGKFSSSITALDPEQMQMMSIDLPDIVKPAGGNHMALLNFNNIPVMMPGDFTFVLKIGAVPYTRKLRVKVQPTAS